ncbi:hypothetical protein CC1G_08530 [Coprinopsis cinerea okayama7|uniref:Uncharacterized protein n=1 Tax=Coprinopsis cinerea (strain Okayama-7 / 130 / ATCC MYA-4618 / FGSC 9003) TaxID=240176 RepID=A8ND53_COPC7|nr:hypothetical protein CC1G_08530 [Coprinopsis cinerea okayama7\|eukprot:XP_001832702.2 hypothetical protein CC1G_08530 [Coprinopsis cinerea okayama7\
MSFWDSLELRKINPQIDWRKGTLHIPAPKVASVTIEEIPDEDAQIPYRGAPSDPTPDPAPEPEEEPPLLRIRANRVTRRKWVRAGLIEATGDELWCAAGFTYSQKIAEEAQKTKPQKTFEEMVPPHYRQHASVFSESESHRLPEHKPWDHAIDLIPGAPATMRTKVYPMSQNEQEELNRFLDENLKKGYIRPSKSPLSSPVFFVKKKDGKLRFVQDYRRLNEITVKNRYPLPLVSDIINRLRGAKYFTCYEFRPYLFSSRPFSIT